MAKDHYATLELSETANAEEIKKAFRRLSLKYHPDKNHGKPDTVEMFQKVSEAYETLGDTSKKQEYDMMRKNPFARMASMDGSQEMQFENIDEMFANMFFGGGSGGMPGGIFGFPGGMNMGGMNMGGMNMGGNPNIRIFRNGMPVHMGLEKPTPIIKTVVINMQQVLNGAKIPLEIERWIVENGTKVFETITLYVDIFKGIDQNEIIILREEGNVINQTCKGDVKIFVKIENNTQFIRNGLDLLLEHTISLKEALCGFTYELKHLNERIYTINNKAGNVISPEFKKIIPEMGLTREQHTGNLILQFHVTFPTTLTLQQIAQISEIL